MFGDKQVPRIVTTLRVVWIEILVQRYLLGAQLVTTLRVVWIEILPGIFPSGTSRCHHLAGGVD